MALDNIENLNEVQLDTLKEIGNIGQGNAASALSSMVGKFVNIDLPEVRLLDFSDTVNYLGGAEITVLGIIFSLSGDINGMILQVVHEDVVMRLLHEMLGTDKTSFDELNDTDLSCLQEIGNILAGSYVNAIADLSHLKIDISVPSVNIDMAGALLSIPAIEFAKVGNKVLLIDDGFIIDEGKLKSNMILVPELESLSVLFSRLGVEV